MGLLLAPVTGACLDPDPSSHLLRVWLHEAHTNTVSLRASGAEKEEEHSEMLPLALWLMAPTTRTTSPSPEAPQRLPTAQPTSSLTQLTSLPSKTSLSLELRALGVTVPTAGPSQVLQEVEIILTPTKHL